MQLDILSDIASIDPAQWDALVDDDQPFLRHAFFLALERHDAVGGGSGWHPRYLALRSGGHLIGAAPLYAKDHSFGEFVFDWAWADAYQRLGVAYYPKLVAAVPYTPIGGDRLLIHHDLADEAAAAARDELTAGALAEVRRLGASSLHWLFTGERDTGHLRAKGFMIRSGCQFHWRNRDYRSFADFLDTLSSRHRKKVRAERRAVSDQGVTVEVIPGGQATTGDWDRFHDFYLATFIRKGNHAPLTRGFFREIGASLGDSTLLIFARDAAGRVIAGAFFFLGTRTLYGRHWGSDSGYDRLHFEVCYYRAIEYCIERGLARFEAGAQGEYKVRRGFEPVETRSAHWLADARFASAVGDFLAHERRFMEEYRTEMAEQLPYRSAHAET